MNDIVTTLLASLPTLVTSTAVFYLTRKQNKRDKQSEERTLAQQKGAIMELWKKR